MHSSITVIHKSYTKSCSKRIIRINAQQPVRLLFCNCIFCTFVYLWFCLCTVTLNHFIFFFVVIRIAHMKWNEKLIHFFSSISVNIHSEAAKYFRIHLQCVQLISGCSLLVVLNLHPDQTQEFRSIFTYWSFYSLDKPQNEICRLIKWQEK